MRHHNKNRKFGREKNQRVALLRSLAISLITREKMTTTQAKAKELRPYVEKLVTRAKTDTLASRRHTLSLLGNADGSVRKLFASIAPRYKERQGGYLRITKLSNRKSDASPRAQIEFV